jgi:hypothetical protein
MPRSLPSAAESVSDRLSEMAPLLVVANEARDVGQPPSHGRSSRRLVGALDVFHPGLAGSHLLVRCGHGDRSGPLVELSVGGVACLF